ncbi:piggyBac transposable element-derived protein 3-like [Anopheles cruzii]|uniref:piggyBac transposable element-derived protein 3-like n=1 Tax=Anopheles cruzii TaxID=68878 RepID=UPI0022EC5FE5|nr:piggyBac transposable element-derived protein 3-like [Anopheles cruzii]
MSGELKNINLWVEEEAEYLLDDEDIKAEEVDYIEEYVDFSDEQGLVQYESIVIEDVPHELNFESPIWSNERPSNVDNSSSGGGRKIAQSRSGPLGLAKLAKTPSECLFLFLDPDVIATITEYTNEKIKEEQSNYTRDRDANPTDEAEILAVLGILFIAGTIGSGRQNINYLFDSKKGTGMEAVYLTMTVHRFHFVLRSLRFDDPVTAADDLEADKLAPIRAIYERIVNNFHKYYRPTRHLALDEQITFFKGVCDFRVNFPIPQNRSGFKFHLLVDCTIPYTCNMEIFLPNNHEPYNLSNAPEDVALRMTESVQGKNKIVTLGANFATLEVIKKLHEKRTMTIGEVNKSCPSIPKAFKVAKRHEDSSTLVAYHESVKLISHVSKRRGLCILMSSHDTGEDDEQTDKVEEETDSSVAPEPKLVTQYNQYKNVVKTIQQMCSMYDTSRSTRRWPLMIFFNLMNLSSINAWCIYRLNLPESNVNRRDFLVDMALEMIRPHARRRLDSKALPRTLKTRLGMFLGVAPEEYEDREVYRELVCDTIIGFSSQHMFAL